MMKAVNVHSAKILLKSVTPHGLVVYYRRRKNQKTDRFKDVEKNKKIALITPAYANEYINLMKDAISRSNYEVADSPEDARYIWLHWYEDIRSTDEFLQKIANIKAWKEQGRKIIYQIHNKAPHDSLLPSLAKAQMVAMADVADAITIHSNETMSTLKSIWDYGEEYSKVVNIPHPNYIGAYGKSLTPPKLLSNDKLRILFFGMIRPYKGLESLIEATEGLNDIAITICGSAPDNDYKTKIQALVEKRSDITIRFEYVSNEHIPKLLSEHHIVALPYLLKSSLNSGAAILAFSYHRTVVGSNNGTLRDLPEDLYFGYDYKEDQDNTKQLRNTIVKIQEDYHGKYNELIDIGDKAYDFVKRNNSEAVVSSKINETIKLIDEKNNLTQYSE